MFTLYISKKRPAGVSFFGVKPLMLLLCITALLTAAAGAQQQQTVDQKLRLAQRLEQQGELETALTFYAELYTEQPNNIVFANNYCRILERLKLFDDWIKVLNDRIAKQKQNPTFPGELGRAYFLKGEEQKAKEIWQAIIDENPKRAQNYSIVSSYYQRVRLYDEAIETYLTARKELGNPAMYANQLANLYQVRRDYPNSAREWLRWVSTDKRYFNMAEQTINRFPNEPEVVAGVTGVLEEIAADSANVPEFRRLLAGYYIKNREYRKAFEAFRELDKTLETDGSFVLGFADQVFKIGAYDFAIEGYSWFMERHPDNKAVPRAHIGLAQSYETGGFAAGTEAADSAAAAGRAVYRDSAVREYRRIAATYKDAVIIVEARYHLGNIFFSHLYDYDRAIQELQAVRRIAPGSKYGWQAVMRIGDCFLAKGNVQAATQYYTMLEQADKSYAELKQSAAFKLLLSEYFRGNFSELKARLDELIAGTPYNSELSNDLLALSIFIDENLYGGEEQVQQYAFAELLLVQHKQSEALARLDRLKATGQGHPVADDAYMLSAKIRADMQNYQGAIAVYTQVQELFPESPFSERAQIAIGEIYESYLHDAEQAAAAYENFLINYPDSIHLDEIRQRLRKLKASGEKSEH